LYRTVSKFSWNLPTKHCVHAVTQFIMTHVRYVLLQWSRSTESRVRAIDEEYFSTAVSKGVLLSASLRKLVKIFSKVNSCSFRKYLARLTLHFRKLSVSRKILKSLKTSFRINGQRIEIVMRESRKKNVRRVVVRLRLGT